MYQNFQVKEKKGQFRADRDAYGVPGPGMSVEQGTGGDESAGLAGSRTLARGAAEPRGTTEDPSSGKWPGHSGPYCRRTHTGLPKFRKIMFLHLPIQLNLM